MQEATSGSSGRGEPRSLRFGNFELRLASGELLRAGEPVPLQRRPARVLEALARRPGRTVLRREIQEAVWGPDAHVDADQSINYCIRQIRLALDDDTESPRYIQTVPRRGYRFIAPVAPVGEVTDPGPAVEALGDGSTSRPPSVAAAPESFRVRPRFPESHWAGRTLAAGILCAALGLGVMLVFGEAPGGLEPFDREARSPVFVPERAHDRYLEARYLLDRAAPEQYVRLGREAIGLLEESLSEAPEYAPAWTALAEAWLFRLDLPRPEAMERSTRAARTALELDPTLGKAHEILATSGFFHRLDWEGTVRHLERALEADPGSTDALFLKALVLSAAGRHRRALATARRAIELDPGMLQIASLGWLHFFAREYEQAIQEADRVLALVPTDEPSHRVKVYAALELGDEARALGELERYWRLQAGAAEHVESPWSDAVGFFREALEEVRVDEGWTNPALPATFAVYAGSPQQALSLLLQACEERSGGWDLPFVPVDPRWDPIRGEDGFERLLGCVGSPASAVDPLLRPAGSGRGGARIADATRPPAR